MEKNCRLCKSKNLLEYYQLSNKRGVIYECDDCGFIQLPVPPVDELDSVASEESIIQDIDRGTSVEDMKLNKSIGISGPMSKMAHVMQQDSIRVNKLIKKITDEQFPSLNELKFIDIGSGYGQHSFNLKKEFPEWDFHLLEISKERMKSGIKSFKPNLNEFTFHHCLLDDEFANNNFEKFDISFLFHVLEHVYDITGFIKNLFEITKKGGLMVLELPNEDDDLSLLSDKYREIIHFPAHVSHFTKNTLSKLLDESGISSKVDVSFIPIQRYGFFNYIDWVRHNEKSKIISDDYTPRENPSWVEKNWLKNKEENFTTDTITMVITKR